MRIIARLGRLVAHALEPRELLLGLLEHVLGHLGLGDLRAVLLDDRALVLAELLADRVELAAEDVLALLLLDAGLDVLLDAPAHLHEREALALQLERELEALAHVDGLEELHLLLEGDVGRVARRVGERARLGDRADEGGDAAVVAAQLEDLLDDRAVLALELADAAVGRLRVGPLLDVDEEAALRIGGGGAGDAAVQSFSATARPPPGRRMRSVTSATVPTFAYSSSCLGTSSTRSSSPTSTVRVTFMLGKTTMSSRGTRSRRVEFSVSLTILAFVRYAIVGSETVPTTARAASSALLSLRCGGSAAA